jgi:hypothetical protein
MWRFVAVCATCLLCCARGPAADPENGIYAVKDDSDVRRIGPNIVQKIPLGPRIGRIPAEATIVSAANDNSRFFLILKNIEPLNFVPGFSQIVAVVDGIYATPHGQSQRPDGTSDRSFTIQGMEAARKVAASLKVEPRLRTNPGYRIEVRWTPDKSEYRAGEPITLKLELRNVGTTTLAYQDGGKQRGSRDNQFQFVARHAGGQGPSVPDTGNPWHMGGIGGTLTLKPGESMTKTVQLDKWFKFTEPDTYRITGSFELELHDPAGELPFRVPMWDDLATGECLIRIVAEKK